MWDVNLDKMNENKKGKPYSFPDSFLLIIGYMRIYFHLPYRQTEGIIKASGKNLPVHPTSYSQICRRRVNKLNTTSKRLNDDNDDGIIISLDSTGIKVTNRGQWIQEK
jgi:Transposase DDE domain